MQLFQLKTGYLYFFSDITGANAYKGLAMTDNSDSDDSQELFNATQHVKPGKSSQNGYIRLSQSDDYHAENKDESNKEQPSLLKNRSHLQNS